MLGCCSEEIGKSKFNSMIGLVDRERVDAELYDDFETQKAREVCILLLQFSLCLISLTQFLKRICLSRLCV